jgi:hypothetical protein
MSIRNAVLQNETIDMKRVKAENEQQSFKPNETEKVNRKELL